MSELSKSEWMREAFIQEELGHKFLERSAPGSASHHFKLAAKAFDKLETEYGRNKAAECREQLSACIQQIEKWKLANV